MSTSPTSSLGRRTEMGPDWTSTRSLRARADVRGGVRHKGGVSVWGVGRTLRGETFRGRTGR